MFGTSELAIAAVLAAYMGGLALGARLIERPLARLRRPVLWYAALELGIAVSALALLPAGLWCAERILVLAFGGHADPPDATMGGTSLFYLLAAALVLLVPTTLMGATLPLLARHAVHGEEQIGSRIGLLYACNAGGAVAGALLGSLLLLPGLGLRRTTWMAAGVNLLVAALALGVGRRAAHGDASGVSPTVPAARGTRAERLRAGVSPAWVLPLMLVSGAVSFLHEVLWTRMLGHVLGSSIRAFGVMLAAFLAGIALGGGLGAALANAREGSARRLALSELAAGLAAVGAWFAIQHLGPDVESPAQRVLLGIALLLPLAVAIGVTYPLAVRVLATGVADAAGASARVYTWNTVGAILGALGGSFLVVPALRYEGAVQLAVCASAALAVAAGLLPFRARLPFAAGLTAAALALAVSFRPVLPEALLRYSPLRVSGKGELLFYDTGRSAAVVALRLGDQISLRTNGLPDAAIDLRGTGPQLYAEAWMAPLAVLARPQLSDLLVVGLGGGRVLEAVAPSVRRVDVIELEDKVVDANRSLAARRAVDPLRDARLHLVGNDARGALQLTTRRYDAVISQPSHPWTAGASHLYTREFMQQARAHLNPGGLFVQWMNVDFLDEPLLRSLVATLGAVFPHVRLYRPSSPTLLFLASDEPIEPERHPAGTRAVIAAAPDLYGRLGLDVVEDLVVALAMDDAGCRAFAAGAPLITDDDNRFAVASVFDAGRSLGATRLGELLASRDPLLQPDGFIQREEGSSLAFDYIARRIHAYVPFDDSARTRMDRLAALLPDGGMQAYVRSLALHDDARSEDAQRARAADAQAHPDSSLLRDAALEGRLVAAGYAVAGDSSAMAAGAPAVPEAARRAARGDWSGVAALDDALAQIPWTSLWNDVAVRLRVEWRVRAPDAAARARHDAESLALIDRMNAFLPDPRLTLLRAMSAGGDARILMESLFRYSLLVLQGHAMLDDAARRDLTGLRARFAQLRFVDPVDRHHALEVQAAVDAVLR